MPILTPEERVGTLLAGRYRLESILGSGGTSVVYRASHTWTGRAVALKLLKPEHARDKGLVMRFLREARTASTILHPNVVTILDMGTDPEGDVYLAMELLAGESLGELLDRESKLAPARAIELLRPIMEAVSVAHQRGIVHRDIKPDNVFVGDRGDGVVRPILLDFGMAKTTEAAWGHATQSGLIVGTPFYMSPEQAEGAPDVGAASDAWSMGVLLYRCLAGALPFFASSPTSLLLAIVRGDHVPLSERAPEVPAALASVIERALSVDRADRYADMGEMLSAIDRAQRGEGEARAVAAAKSTPVLRDPSADAERERAAGRARGRSARLAAAAVLLLAALGAAGAIGIGAARGGHGDELLVTSPTAPESLVAPERHPEPPPVAAPGAAVEPTVNAAGEEPAAAPESAAAPASASAPASAAAPASTAAQGRALEPAGDGARAGRTEAGAVVAPQAEAGAERSRRRRGLARSFDDREADGERAGSGLATEW